MHNTSEPTDAISFRETPGGDSSGRCERDGDHHFVARLDVFETLEGDVLGERDTAPVRMQRARGPESLRIYHHAGSPVEIWANVLKNMVS